MSSLLGRSNSNDQQELREQQERNQEHMTMLSQPVDDGESMQEAYIDKMTGSRLEQGTINLLSNLLSEDFVLGNFSDAEVHEFRWLARVIRLEVEALHPDEESVWTGEFRKIAFDDSYQALSPLDDAELAIIEQFIMGVISRATRGRDGWQQEMFNKTIHASERRDLDDDDDGGLML